MEVEFYYGEISATLLDAECEKPRRLGPVTTPYGSINVSVLYRTPKQIERVMNAAKQLLVDNLPKPQSAPLTASLHAVNSQPNPEAQNIPRKVCNFINGDPDFGSKKQKCDNW